MFSVLRQTNFDSVIGEFLLDYALVQPYVGASGDDEEPIKFITVPQYLIAFEEGFMDNPKCL